jgi:hypothetical protein
LIALILVVLSIFGTLRIRKWWLRRKIGTRVRQIFRRDPARAPIFAAYRSAQRQLNTYRGQTQTVQEHAVTEPELQELAALVDIAAYRPQPPEPSLIERARAWRKLLSR